MSEQNQNPDDEQPVFTKTEMNAIVQQRLQQDRARRGNPPPASTSTAAPSFAAPAASGLEQRFERLESMFGNLIERMTPAAAQAPQVPQSAPQAAPAAAPAPPQTHTLPTAMGFPDLWNMTPEQFVQFRSSGALRPTLEKMWEAGARLQGAPQRPLLPFVITPGGEKIASPHFTNQRSR